MEGGVHDALRVLVIELQRGQEKRILKMRFFFGSSPEGGGVLANRGEIQGGHEHA